MSVLLKQDREYGGRMVSLHFPVMRLMKQLVSSWDTFREDQRKQRRLYLSSPQAQHIPWRVWKAHSAMLMEISEKRK